MSFLYSFRKMLSVGYSSLRRANSNSELRIGFSCGFHGKTGAPIAISSIANMLSKAHKVYFELPSESYYRSLLEPSVNIVVALSEEMDIVLTDLRITTETINRIKLLSNRVILTIHGLKPAENILPKEKLEKLFSFADLKHIVGEVQQNSYNFKEDEYFIIPNTVAQFKKTNLTNNIGVVGNLNKLNKNVLQSVEYGLMSNCDEIHLWFCSDLEIKNDRVICHNWEESREKIYNSFDVLVFFSKKETFGLSVAEALSAGIPCVLSNIEAFSVFADCPGVVLLDEDNLSAAPAYINKFLEQKEELRQPITDFFQHNFSAALIQKMWLSKVTEIISMK